MNQGCAKTNISDNYSADWVSIQIYLNLFASKLKALMNSSIQNSFSICTLINKAQEKSSRLVLGLLLATSVNKVFGRYPVIHTRFMSDKKVLQHASAVFPLYAAPKP